MFSKREGRKEGKSRHRPNWWTILMTAELEIPGEWLSVKELLVLLWRNQNCEESKSHIQYEFMNRL